MSGETRFRFEHLDEPFRAEQNGSDQVLMARTLIQADLKSEWWSFNTELIDARSLAGIDDEDSHLGTGTHNPIDIQQLNVRLYTQDVACTGCLGELTFGRFTLDLGSRRFVARNRFRNTINAFSGAHFQWKTREKKDTGLQHWQAFYTKPVQRKFDGDAGDNQPELDNVTPGTQFWGVSLTYNTPTLSALWYLLGLDEEDRPSLPTRDRELYTFVSDFRPVNHNSAWPWQIELAYQWGHASPTRTENNTLNVEAFSLHLESFYRFKNKHSLGVIYDYASGDKRADDGRYQRFDPLFGTRRPDFGPTGIYNPFAGANLISPGLRWQTADYPWGQVLSTWRYFRLAERGDAWTSTGFRVANEQSSTSIGEQLELRWRWKNTQNTVALEAGTAYLNAGSLMKAAEKRDSHYAYSQIAFSF